MVLLDAALHLVYELSYRCHYAHRRPSAARLVQIMVPTMGRTVPRLHRPARDPWRARLTLLAPPPANACPAASSIAEEHLALMGRGFL